MADRIAITPRSLSEGGHPALEPLTAAGFELVFPSPGRLPSLAEQKAVLPSCVGYLAGVEPVPAGLLRQCPSLRVISRNGAGTDAIDLATAEQMGIAVRAARGANAEGVAELTIALMLAGLRHVPWSSAGVKTGQWRRLIGVEVRDRTIGVIGCGQIGRRVVELGLAMGMNALAFDQFEDTAFRPSDRFAYTALDDLLRRADVVSLHCPPADRPVIDAAALRQMRQGSYLINTARSTLVDDRAVLTAIDRGRLVGFATDVYDEEPPRPSELLRHDRVIATPHAGGFTVESVERATRAAVENMLQVLAPH